MLDFAALLESALTVTPAQAGAHHLNAATKALPPHIAAAASGGLAIAVSGGPDSVALLHLAATAFPGQITALTVDHGLRPAAALEAATLARHCAAAQIPHHILNWEGEKPTANLQASARTARYRLMTNWCAQYQTPLLATAHHADDQAETLLMRLARGSGTPGLAGIRPHRDLGQGVTLVRPLLTIRRAVLAKIAAGTGWTIADDPTNRDPHHDRTHARALLTATSWLDPARLAAAAAHLAAAETALQWTTDLAFAGRAITAPDSVLLDTSGLPPELTHRLTLRAIAALTPAATPSGPAVTALIARLHTGKRATIGTLSITAGHLWRFTIAPPRRQKAAP